MIGVTVLIEDTVTMPGLMGEHGLSFHIETKNGNILFDTGQTALVRDNANKLGVDLARVDAIFLSHGHYDHTGGLMKVMGATGTVDVYAHPDVFMKRYGRIGKRRLKKKGPPWKRAEAEKLGARFCLNRGPVEILKNIFTSGEIERVTPFEKPDGRLVVRKGGRIVQDPFRDDQCIVAVRGKWLFVFLGCCHAGLINTLAHVSRLFPEKRIRVIVGGLHLLRSNEEIIKKTIESLRAFSPDLVAACHCTGFKASAILHEALGKRFMPITTGEKLEF